MLSLLFFIYAIVSGSVIYVKQNSTGGNGQSWGQAFNNLQDALNVVAPGDKIWVAKGTYKPTVKYAHTYTGTESNLVTFKLPSNIAIYGGFAGTETAISQRNLNTNPTILSGDINGDDVNGSTYINKTDNAWHIVSLYNVINTIVDGFVVQNGYAAGPDNGTVIISALSSTIVSINYMHAAGAGVLIINSSVVLNNIQFKNNIANSSRATMITLNPPIVAIAAGGAAAELIGHSTHVTMTNCKFNNNLAIGTAVNGGAINILLGATITINNGNFNGNQGSRNGGAIHARDSGDVTVTFTSFTNNRATGAISDESGGAIGIFNANLFVTSCTFDSNFGGRGFGGGGAIFYHLLFDDGETYRLVVTGSIFTNNDAFVFGGGAINIFGIKPRSSSFATITSCVFNYNTGGIGGALYIDAIPTNIIGSSFYKNKAWRNGGALFGSGFSGSVFGITNLSDRALITITGSTFDSNMLIGIPPGTTTLGLPPEIFSPQFILDIFAKTVVPPFNLSDVALTVMAPGGGAVVSQMGANVRIINSVFTFNNASIGSGGAILVGGSNGFAGGNSLGMKQAYLSVTGSMGFGNIDQSGSNNVRVLDLAALGNGPNGVSFVTDGSI